jgi:hypothetical protein
MTDRENYAGHFSTEIDRILEQQGRFEGEGPPPEYAEMLALAKQLAALDFSGDSRLRRPLRRRLLNRLEADRATVRWQPRWPRYFPAFRPRRALGVLVALSVLVMLVGWTPAGRAFAQAVGNLIQEMRWPHTTVQQVSPGIQPTITPQDRDWCKEEMLSGQAWELTFEGRTFGGCASSVVRNEVVSLSQAVDEAGFEFRLPAFLPTGFVLSEVRLLDVSPHHVFLTYDGTSGRLGLYQFLVGVISEEHPSENVAVVESRAVGVLTGGTVEEVRVGPTLAALIDGERLVWEQGGISFHLIGPGLEAETLVQIAESLLPAKVLEPD